MLSTQIDRRPTDHRHPLAGPEREDRGRSARYEFIDCFADLVLAAEAAAGRHTARAA